jgi:hypothetical protein
MNQVSKIDPTENLPADPMVSMIERVAMDPNADIAKLERMLELKERHDAQNAKAAFDAAFAKASARFPEIPLNGKNLHNNTRYAKLKDIIKLTRPILAEHGLALSFSTETNEKEVIVTAELSHESGHTKSNSLPLPRDTGAGRNAVQAIGSSQTYGQRYTAQAILGLSLGEDDEDDGASSGRVQQPVTPRNTSWEKTITDELPPNATPRDMAEAIAQALCAQFKRMNGLRQIDNEWDRRAHLIAGEKGLEGKHPDLWEEVIDAYENRKNEIEDAARVRIE